MGCSYVFCSAVQDVLYVELETVSVTVTDQFTLIGGNMAHVCVCMHTNTHTHPHKHAGDDQLWELVYKSVIQLQLNTVTEIHH